MAHPVVRRGRTWATVLIAVLAVAVTAPRPGSALSQLAGPGAATDPFAPLVAGVSLLAWVVAAWLALSVVVTVASDCGGWTGRIGRALSRRLVPAVLRRALQLGLGLTVAVGALGATTVSASALDPVAPSSSPAPANPAGPSLDWPTVPASPPSPTPASTPSAGPVPSTPSPSPGRAARAAGPAATETPLVPPGPVEVPAGGARDAEVTPAPVTAAPSAARLPSSAGSVLVTPGDSLWSISRAHLRAAGADASPAAVARAWPQWWEANRQVVGEDPDLVHPGTRLAAP
ncbi:MAG: Peptidoglycan-binding lysin domain protein [Frankiales bacterium]|nr:Peptidoglycan-binding lysin domain protein [Frankiales bacterium]